MARAEDLPQPTPEYNLEYNPRTQTGAGREYHPDTPSKRINSNPLPEILYIQEKWVND